MIGLNALIFIGEFIGVNAQTDEIGTVRLIDNNSKSLNDLYNKTKDSVVQIITEYQLTDPSDRPYYLSGNNTNAMKFGSGFVYDKSGIIITAYHIVSSANNIMVTFNNGNSYNVFVVGVDPFEIYLFWNRTIFQ
ncbi:MAG: S1C family serine protease [Candidatus Nitrosocosmicus sp.]|nr:S1C family serine protease [Candidatus Nitrosocosmicus sp.]